MKFDPLNISKTFLNAMQQSWNDPAQAVDNQMRLAENYIKLWGNVTERFLGKEIEPLYKSEGKDTRFKDEAWQNNPVFDFIKQSYFLNSNWIQDVVSEIKHTDSKDKQKLDFYTKLLIDAMSPTNFMLTNPEVIKETLATNGQNLLKGAENLIRDLKKSKNGLQITTADSKSFAVGENLAITAGKVIYQNDLMQLIQYTPTTNKVCKTPLLVIPAWINKYYILDLQDKNSFVKWLIEQEFTVFMISWNNPDENHHNKSFADYMVEGPLAAIEEIKKICKVDSVNTMGYCLGGTLLACTIAYLKGKTKNIPIKSATFLTSLVDFSEAGDLSVFIDDAQLSALEKRMSEKGYLDGHEMAQTFNMIRANDMIWSFYINNYLMGKDPFPFDILYWNSDSTRLPAKMHSFYLRNMYEKNLLVKPGEIKLLDTPIDLHNIDVPVYILSTKEDHITPWEATYKGTSIYSGKTRFVLSGSGHVAGVVNHPSRQKYNYWTNDKIENTAKKWLTGAHDNPGSWWGDWVKWATPLSNEKVPARIPAKTLENAPGSYVKKRL